MTEAVPRSSYSENAAYWVDIIRQRRDRYRLELTDPAILGAAGDVAGMDVLDAGCGEGYLSRALAAGGGRLTGADLCAELVVAAREQSAAESLDIAYHVADVADLPLADVSVDLVVANHLLNDIEDTGPVLREFARVLRPRGRLVAILLHPCFYGRRDGVVDAADYFGVRSIAEPFKVAGRQSPAPAMVWLRPLGDHVRTFADAGLSITWMSEPRPTDEQMADPWWVDHFRFPLFLLIEARKAAGRQRGSSPS